MKILISRSNYSCIIDDCNGDFVASSDNSNSKVVYYPVGSEDPILVADGFSSKKDCCDFVKKLAVLITNASLEHENCFITITEDTNNILVCNNGTDYYEVVFYRILSGLYIIDGYNHLS